MPLLNQMSPSIALFFKSQIGEDGLEYVNEMIVKRCLLERMLDIQKINVSFDILISDDEGPFDIKDFLEKDDNHLFITKKMIGKLIEYVRLYNWLYEYDGSQGTEHIVKAWTTIFAYFGIDYIDL